MNDVFHNLLARSRLEKSMSEADVASIVSLSSNEYYDLENHAAEWRNVTSLFKIKVLTKLLHIDIDAVVPRPPNINCFSRHHTVSSIITFHRNELGLTKEQFADKAGFHPVFADIVEEHPLGLELFPAQVAVLVAEALQINPRAFLYWIINS